MGSLFDSHTVVEPEAHQTTFALVGQTLTDELQHDRIPDPLGSNERLARIVHDCFRRERCPECRKHLFGFVFTQRSLGGHGFQR